MSGWLRVQSRSVGQTDVDAGRQRPQRGQALGEPAQHGAELGLDPVPQAGQGRLGHRGLANDPQQVPHPVLGLPGLARGRPDQRHRVVALQQLPVPGPFRHRDGLVVPAEADVPQPVQHAGLGAEREVDRLERDARPVGDGGHGDGGVAVPREQLPGRVEDLAPGLGGLLPPPRRVVPPPGFDSTWHSATLSMYSLLNMSSQITGGHHDRHHATGAEHQDDRTGPARVVPRRLRPGRGRTGRRRRAPRPAPSTSTPANASSTSPQAPATPP